tara:strand:- start:675 stop:950 length:276 start_codon:yes stop_codon:yes gene_type:complete
MKKVKRETLPESRTIFWDMTVTEHKKEYRGGFYYRSELKDFLKRLEDNGEVVVGIAVDRDDYNIEFITEISDKSLEDTLENATDLTGIEEE